MCSHTETEIADQTCYLTQSQFTDIGLTSPSADSITSGAWQCSHWNANSEVIGMAQPGKKSTAKEGIEPRSAAVEAGTRPLDHPDSTWKKIHSKRGNRTQICRCGGRHSTTGLVSSPSQEDPCQQCRSMNSWLGFNLYHLSLCVTPPWRQAPHLWTSEFTFPGRPLSAVQEHEFMAWF